MTVADLAEMPGNSYVDLLVCVASIGNRMPITMRSGEVRAKRMVSVTDESTICIEVCFWSADVDEHLDPLNTVAPGSVLLLKGARLVEFKKEK